MRLYVGIYIHMYTYKKNKYIYMSQILVSFMRLSQSYINIFVHTLILINDRTFQIFVYITILQLSFYFFFLKFAAKYGP